MSESKHLPIEEMDLFILFESVSDWAWEETQKWKPCAQHSIGSQLVGVADSIGANLVEGDGRYGDADSNRFFVIARASASETRLWIRRAAKRNLFDERAAMTQIDAIENAARMFNRLISVKRNRANGGAVREIRKSYNDLGIDDPLAAATDTWFELNSECDTISSRSSVRDT